MIALLPVRVFYCLSFQQGINRGFDGWPREHTFFFFSSFFAIALSRARLDAGAPRSRDRALLLLVDLAVILRMHACFLVGQSLVRYLG